MRIIEAYWWLWIIGTLFFYATAGVILVNAQKRWNDHAIRSLHGQFGDVDEVFIHIRNQRLSSIIPTLLGHVFLSIFGLSVILNVVTYLRR